MIRTSYLLMVFLFFSVFSTSQAQDFSQREINIGKNDWYLWIDSTATWENDKLYLPSEVVLSEMPVNPPTLGWDKMYALEGQNYTLPLVVEEIYCNGNSKKEYHGVSWFYSSISFPKDIQDKIVRLCIDKFNSRIEVYINNKLAGYDLIAGTPYVCDISKFIVPGKENKIALRITNPGGQRGWNDFPVIPWGKYKMLPHHDFGGIGGDVILKVTDKIYIEDVFVKNELPAKGNSISVTTAIINTTDFEGNADLKIDIRSNKTGEIVFSTDKRIDIKTVLNNHTFRITVPTAKVWSLEKPNLYSCDISLSTSEYSHDYSQTFGFRVFEVKANEAGEQNFYLNGKRIRHRSAIDWGYYVNTGYYPDESMAEKSVKAAKEIGYNGINFHRNIGEPLVLKKADELGLMIYEEPGGFSEDIKLYDLVKGKPEYTFEGQLISEKCRRMVIRDRNHPALMIFNLANERDNWDLLRKNIMHDMHRLDNSKLIVNQSGGFPGGPAGPIPHIRPYESVPRLDFFDDHTVGSESRFQEYDFQYHQTPKDKFRPTPGRIDPLKHNYIVYWGEVRSYTGPDNSWKLCNQNTGITENRPGYDINSFVPLSKLIDDYFRDNRLDKTGSRVIKTPASFTEQAARGLMYTDGRLSQIIMGTNSYDGFAMNAWSGCSPDLPKGHHKNLEYYSSLLDEGRNIKGPATDLSFWTKELQIAIYRQNGKYFLPGNEVKLDFTIINEGHIGAGNYILTIKVKDGAGNYTDFEHNATVKVKGGDTYAQKVLDDFSIILKDNMHAGYITIEASLNKNGNLLTSGVEQVLLKNRKSYKKELEGSSYRIINWDAAAKALKDAGVENLDSENPSVVLVGEAGTSNTIEEQLKEVKKKGATLILKFDTTLAEILYNSGLLSQKVTDWGGIQTPRWMGNGWGYIDYLIGEQALPGTSTIGTNGWEVDDDPIGFAPFKSKYKQTSYGAYIARPDVLLTLIGEIEYGKGKIVLLPTYPVDDNKAFNDLLFFNTVLTYSK
ncbi:glycoside hydrolase family 2 TIM barrel-domain containing protein [Ulvibacterium sp.]|uniref:glycoside hydrolase family 2 TIM barrel-domain containing protein n=1 Tax=Ulvibacterium sp. TaxID=2665914 RepID=UPI003BAD43E0